ncbi:MAG: hypothetical protein CVV30_05650 [Methanomicrobiales archaeon HGW-Methanomicrobiales-1]|nr:MAG: hypothetical protein CVV30_05650 [Methanomicrobiales archaeon HGW-Methanomicrobiales-1]
MAESFFVHFEIVKKSDSIEMRYGPNWFTLIDINEHPPHQGLFEARRNILSLGNGGISPHY